MTVAVNDDLESLDLAEALDAVSPERRAYALGYRFDRDRQLSVAGYLLLKRALREVYGLVENPRLAHAPNGKPILPDHPDIHFNLSHCAKAAACAVSGAPVGIDVEEIAPINWDVARRVLSDAECTEVRLSSEPEVVFARFWTRKEAFVKLSGNGIDDKCLPHLLEEAQDVQFDTSVNRLRGYVLTTASRTGDPHGVSSY